MVSDRLPEWGVTRSTSTLAIDVVEAAVFVVGHFLAVLLSSAVWLALGALFAAVLPAIEGVVPLPDGLTAEAFATVVWLALVVVGPAVVVARVLRAPVHPRLTDHPIVVLTPPILLLGATLAVVVETGATRLPLLALVVAGYVVVRRVVHLYAQHVRAGPLSRRGRFRLATAALVPLSLLLLYLAADLLGGVVPLGDTGFAFLRSLFVAMGVPALVDVGDATFDVHVLALLAAPLALCGGYVLLQVASAVVRYAQGDDRRPGPVPTADLVAHGRFSIPGNGSMAVWLWTALGGSAPATGGTVALPDSKADWKYDDPDAERAHRRAQTRDPAEAVEIGEVVPLVLEEADYSSDPPTVMGSRNALKVFVEDVPRGLSERDTICVKVTDYGGKRTSAEAVFLSRGRCSDADRRA